MSSETLDDLLRYWARLSPDRVFLSSQTQLTFAETDAEVESRARRLGANASGAPLLLAGANDQFWTLNLLAAFRSRVPVVLIPQGLTAQEETQITKLAGIALRIEGEALYKDNQGNESERVNDWEASGAALAFTTSGSMGLPRLALRSAASLISEGERYRRLWQMTPDDAVAAVLPLSYAYAFGAALSATLVTGATLVLGDNKSPRRLVSTLTDGQVTILPLVGPVARALALIDDGKPVESRLRVAMVGAGMVTASMSQLFEAKCGLPLSQNYGSSETGALLASFPPDSVKGTGFPMLDVECRLSKALDSTSQLWVRTATPPLGYMTESGFEAARLSPDYWWATGDLFSSDGAGLYTMTGRLGQEIRRGGHTIQPREVERALLEHPAVDEALVRGGKDWDDQECVEAHVVLRLGVEASITELRGHMLSQLAPYKCPTRWHIKNEFKRTWSNKPVITSEDSVKETDGTAIFKALLSHRLSTAIITAHGTGLLDELSKHSRTPGEIAATLKLDYEALRIFLKYLSAMGMVLEEGDEFRMPPVNNWWRSTIKLEEHLQQSWLSAKSVIDVLRLGLNNRPFDQARTDDTFERLYVNVMCGPSHDLLAQHVSRLLNSRPQNRTRTLEIGRGIGVFSRLLRQRSASAETELMPLLPGPAMICRAENQEAAGSSVSAHAWPDIIPARGRFDVIFVMNAIHWLKPLETKRALLNLLAGLAPNGHLLIADIFLPAGSAKENSNSTSWLFLLDWMTHGGTNLLTAPEVEAHLAEAGAREVKSLTIGDLPFKVIEALH